MVLQNYKHKQGHRKPPATSDLCDWHKTYKEEAMSDLISAIKNLYTAILLSKQFPEKFSLKDKFLSVRAFKQHFAEKRFLKEKETQILCVIHALGAVAVFKQIPNPPKSETDKVIESIKRAVEMDPDYFNTEFPDESVRDAILFLQKHGGGTKPLQEKSPTNDPVSEKLANELKQKGYTDQDLDYASDFAKKVAKKVHENNK